MQHVGWFESKLAASALFTCMSSTRVKTRVEEDRALTHPLTEQDSICWSILAGIQVNPVSMARQ